MNNIAATIGSTVIYWSSLVIALGAAACFLLTISLYCANGGSRTAVAVFAPVSILLCFFFSRLVFWYSHPQQFSSFADGVFNLAKGDYCIAGVLMGAALAVLVLKAVRLIGNVGLFADCLTPGFAISLAMIRLSELFNTVCRSKIAVNNPSLQHLPLASTVLNAAGQPEYRFATFFVEFLLLMIVFGYTMVFFFSGRKKKMYRPCAQSGHLALRFLVIYSAMEIVLDSTRYDSSYMRSNGFISMVQITAAVILFGVLVYYSVCDIKGEGFRIRHALLWLGWLAGIGGVGITEYLVQRHGNWYLPCYAGMTVAVAVMALMDLGLYRMNRFSEEE